MPSTTTTSTTTTTPRRILVADAHPMFRTGLGHWIRQQDDLTVCAEVATAAEALVQIARRQADLFITDLTLPGRSGLELIRDALALSPRLPLLVLSAHDESLHAERALRAGARGYLMKESSGEDILAAIRWVLAGKVWVSPRMAERLLETIAGCRPRGSQSPIESLTDREFEVFQLIGCGQSTREIASRLHISPKTVEVHRGHLRVKLSLKDSTALIHHAVRWAEAEAESKAEAEPQARTSAPALRR